STWIAAPLVLGRRERARAPSGSPHHDAFPTPLREGGVGAVRFFCSRPRTESRARCSGWRLGRGRPPLPRAPRWSVATVDGRTTDELPSKCAHVESPRGAGGRTQRIEARLLFIAQRIVEFRERGLHGFHCAKRGVEPLLHRIDTTRGGQHLVGRATDPEAFPRLDGGILQVFESGPMRRRWLD